MIALRTVLLSLVIWALPHPARADLYSFTIQFTSGSLSGNEYSGIFATAAPAPNIYAPEGSSLFSDTIEELLSFSITVEGINFHMSEDEWFPDQPFIRIEDDDHVSTIDYVGLSNGKMLGVFLKGNEANSVHFGDIGELHESAGDVIDVHVFSMPDSPDNKSVPNPPPSGDGRYDGLTTTQMREQLGATYHVYGFRRPRNRTSPLAACGDWEWAMIDRAGVHWCPNGCMCGSADPDGGSNTPMVYDFDAGRMRRLEDVRFDERR